MTGYHSAEGEEPEIEDSPCDPHRGVNPSSLLELDERESAACPTEPSDTQESSVDDDGIIIIIYYYENRT